MYTTGRVQYCRNERYPAPFSILRNIAGDGGQANALNILPIVPSTVLSKPTSRPRRRYTSAFLSTMVFATSWAIPLAVGIIVVVGLMVNGVHRALESCFPKKDR